MKAGRIVVATIVVAGAIGALLWWKRSCCMAPEAGGRKSGVGATGADVRPPARVVPKDTRIRIEVLNATDSRGLARQAMFYLRDAGFDVVYFGNTSERSDTTIIRSHSGHADWAALAARVMAPARIEEKPDSSHFLDLSVLIGRRWATARRPLYP